jgi:hypothetical protein
LRDSSGPVPAVTAKPAVTSAAAIAADRECSARAAGPAGTPESAVATCSRPERAIKTPRAGHCPGCAGSTTTADPAGAAVAGGSAAVTAGPAATTTTAGQAGPGGPRISVATNSALAAGPAGAA